MAEKPATHESYTRDEEIKGSSDRGFGIVFVVVFLLIGLWPLTGENGPRIWSLSVAGLLLLIILIRPGLLAPLNRLWMKFGLLVHKIVNPIIMGLIFFLTVLPTGLVMRALGKDLLNQRLDKDAKSYWIDRKPPGPDPDTMINQF